MTEAGDSSSAPPAARGEPVEIEAKLAVTRPRRIASLVRRFELERTAGFEPAGPPSARTETDRYIDTALVGGRLAQQGMRARLRGRAPNVILAVKRTGIEQEGVTTRTELQGPATGSLDPRRWPPSDARSALIEALGGEPLLEIARLRQRRLMRLVRRGATIVELSLDRVEAMAGGAVLARRHELEIELKRGDQAAMASLVAVLSTNAGLGPAHGSKLGFAVAALSARTAADALLDDASA